MLVGGGEGRRGGGWRKVQNRAKAVSFTALERQAM